MMKVPSWVKQLAVGLASGLTIASVQAQSANELSFWIRASDAGFVEPMVKAWNATHKMPVVLTVIPNDDFVTKFGTAVAGGAAPDVVAIDLVFVPTFSKAGQLSDITAEAKALPFADKLSPSHVRLAMYDKKQYAVPFSAPCCSITRRCSRRLVSIRRSRRSPWVKSKRRPRRSRHWAVA